MNHKNHGKRNKQKRHLSAVDRQIERAARTSQEQLLLIADRPGFSQRERARIEDETAKYE